MPSTSRGSIVTPEKSTPSRWKKVNIKRRKKEKGKWKRNTGHSYVNRKGKSVKARELGPPCKCKNNCRQSLQAREEEIFKAFWDLGDYHKQNMYLFSNMKSKPKMRCYPKKTKRNESARKVTIEYSVKVNGQDVKVCKREFLAVHGLQDSKRRVELLWGQMSSDVITPNSDKRGKHQNRPNKISEEQIQMVRQHIDSIPKYRSHYSRKKILIRCLLITI